jgi:hypothetical protein
MVDGARYPASGDWWATAVDARSLVGTERTGVGLTWLCGRVH